MTVLYDFLPLLQADIFYLSMLLHLFISLFICIHTFLSQMQIIVLCFFSITASPHAVCNFNIQWNSSSKIDMHMMKAIYCKTCIDREEGRDNKLNLR
jgi:positive regulator of sigma E activity